MSTDIDLYIYDWDVLRRKFREIGCSEPLLSQILQECGEVIGDRYVLLNNELYENGNPYYTAAHLINSAFGINKAFNVLLWSDDYSKEGTSYVTAEDVAEQLEFKLREDETDEN